MTALSDGPLHVAVVCDDPLLHTGLAGVLERAGVVVVSDLADADVALWDAGTDAARARTRTRQLSRLTVPALAIVPEPAVAADALAAGARGAVLRDQLADALIAALAAIRAGLTVLGPVVATAALAPAIAAATAPPDPGDRADEPAGDALTAREREVVELLAQGLSNKQIAAVLDISGHTAKFHVTSIMAKLGASTRTEAVVRALRRGLVLL